MENPLNFEGKTALITGGSSGIGNATAQMLRAMGARVHVTGTRGAAGDYDGVDGSDLTGLCYHQLDAGDGDAITHFQADFERLDILINAVGTVVYGRKEFDMETFKQVMDVNLNAIMQLCTKYLPLLRESGGNIVNIGSVASFRAVIGNPAYSASKGGMLTLTKTLAAAWGREGVRVNLVAPGLTDTKMTASQKDNEKRYQQSLQMIPLQRWGKPADIAGAIVYLASPLAAYVTGESIIVDGGMSLT